MDHSLSGIVFLAVIVCAVLLAVTIALATQEFFRRRSWSRQFWLEAQPSSGLGLRTAHRVFQSLTQACREDEMPQPLITTMAISEQQVQVFLAVPSEQAPAPWRAGVNGVSWIAPLDLAEAPRSPQDQFATADAATAPELFVTAGAADHATVFLNLAAAPGPIAITGPRRVRRQLLRRWISELTEPIWRLNVNALVVGDATLVSGRATIASETLRADSSRDFPGGLLVVGSAPEAERLRAAHERGMADGHRKLATVIDGLRGRAAWTLHAGDNGTLTSSLFPAVDWRQSPELAVGSAQ